MAALFAARTRCETGARARSGAAPVRVRVRDPAVVDGLLERLHRANCRAERVSRRVLAVTIPDALEDEAQLELRFFLAAHGLTGSAAAVLQP